MVDRIQFSEAAWSRHSVVDLRQDEKMTQATLYFLYSHSLIHRVSLGPPTYLRQSQALIGKDRVGTRIKHQDGAWSGFAIHDICPPSSLFVSEAKLITLSSRRTIRFAPQSQVSSTMILIE